MKPRTLIAGTVIAVLAASCSGSGDTTSTDAVDSSTTSTRRQVTSTSTLPETETTVAVTTSDSAGIDVMIPTDGLDLAGTLRLPPQEGPVPAVVLIHGSGPQSRDSVLSGQLNMGFGFDIPVFAEIAESLEEDGIAVLTYDKRTCGPFNGCAENGYPMPGPDLTVDTFVHDAVAAVEYLRSRPEVDPDRVSIVGHSQGGEFILAMLDSDPRLASGVMIAAPFRPVDEIIEAQLDSTVELLEEQGMSEEDALGLSPVASLVEVVDGLIRLRSGGDEPVGGASAAFWNSWFGIHRASLDAAEDVAQPILVLQGEFDWNVPADEAESWRLHLDDAGATGTVRILPCVTHALNCIDTADPRSATPDDLGRHVAPEVIEALRQFLTQPSN